MRLFALLPLLFAIACASHPQDVRTRGGDPGIPDVTSTETPIPPTPTETGSTLPTTTLEGFVGSPCEVAADCQPGGSCIPDADGFPLGMCTEPCDQYCPDAAGYPTTFCASVDRMPTAAGDIADGLCTSRCDFSAYPGVGCRQGYGCAVADRFGDVGVEGYACLPNLDSELTACLSDLADRGIGFETAVMPDSAPADYSYLTCHVEDPVQIHTPILGIDIGYLDDPPAKILMACAGAMAFTDVAEDLVAENVSRISHYGTYNCRTIAGTNELSRHAYGDAIDYQAFTFADGAHWSVYDDWEDGDDTPETDAGSWLYDTVHRWHDEQLWNILLTPEYNSAHDDHFHADMTPGSDFLGVRGGLPSGYLGVDVELQTPAAFADD